MRSHVANNYRTEQIHLQPHGNTVSVTTLAENPFEHEGDIEVVTQESGGMVGPDPQMTSMWGARLRRRPVMTMRQRPLGVAPARRYGGISATDRSVHSVDGLGANLSVTGPAAGEGDAAELERQIQTERAEEAAAAQRRQENLQAAGSAALSFAQTAGNALLAQQQAKVAKEQARKAKAQGKAQTAMARISSMGSRAVSNAQSNWPIIAGGVAVLAVGAFLLMRKKTNPRRRR